MGGWDVCVCVCVCVCVRRHQDGDVKATRFLNDSNFWAISCGRGAFAADGLSFVHTGHTLEPAMLPIVAGPYPFPLKPSNYYLPLDSTCQHHPFVTPPGVS